MSLRCMPSSLSMYAELRSPPNQICVGLDYGTQVPEPAEGVSAKKNACFSLILGGTETAARSCAGFSGWGLFLMIIVAPVP